MQIYILFCLGLLMLAPAADAQQAQVELLYSEKVEGRFRADVEYSKRPDGREFCQLIVMDYNEETSLSLTVPGDRNSTAFIMLSLPKNLLGLGATADINELNFEFVEGGEPTTNSRMGVWSFRVREKIPSRRFVGHMLALRVDDLWGFAKDWYSTSAVFITDEVGGDVASLTLYRAEEVIQNFADCWSRTEGD